MSESMSEIMFKFKTKITKRRGNASFLRMSEVLSEVLKEVQGGRKLFL
jgi:hypothetical protein